MSKFFTWLPGLLLASSGLALASDEMTVSPIPAGLETGAALPAPLSAGRFAALAKKSPFTLASATQENADFAKDLVLSGYVRIEGKDFVMVANRNGPERFMIGTQPAGGNQGMVLEKVLRDPSGDLAKLGVVLRKGTETATLRYESPAAGSSPAISSPGPATGSPAVAPGPVPPAMPQGMSAQDVPRVIRGRGAPIQAPPPQ